MAFVIVSRTALVTMPIMLAVFALLHLKWRTNVVMLLRRDRAGGVWPGWHRRNCSATTETFARDYQIYKELNQPTSIGLRLEFWQKSLRFFAEAPIIGHGTGSTRGLFEQAATGPAVLAGGQVIGNPHNQTLNVAVQWGIDRGRHAVRDVAGFTCCCFAARAWWPGSACWWSCRISSPRCSIRICSISTRDGCMCWASESPAA